MTSMISRTRRSQKHLTRNRLFFNTKFLLQLPLLNRLRSNVVSVLFSLTAGTISNVQYVLWKYAGIHLWTRLRVSLAPCNEAYTAPHRREPIFFINEAGLLALWRRSILLEDKKPTRYLRHKDRAEILSSLSSLSFSEERSSLETWSCSCGSLM